MLVYVFARNSYAAAAQSWMIMSAPFSAIASVGVLVFPLVMFAAGRAKRRRDGEVVRKGEEEGLGYAEFKYITWVRSGVVGWTYA